jgi:hypothetical protein
MQLLVVCLIYNEVCESDAVRQRSFELCSQCATQQAVLWLMHVAQNGTCMQFVLAGRLCSPYLYSEAYSKLLWHLLFVKANRLVDSYPLN